MAKLAKKKVAAKKRGAPQHKATVQERNFVRILYIGGYNQDEIAKVLVIAPTTLRRRFRDELDLGKARTDAMVTQSIIHMAQGGKGTEDSPADWTRANPSMASFYAKCRMGWKEPKQEIAHSGAVGTFDMSKLSDEEVDHITDILERAANRSPAADNGGGPDGVAGGEGEAESGSGEA